MMSPDDHESEQSSPEPSPSATRDLLANERTLLAWARTGVAIMGLGFVVARFGLVIRELAGAGVRQLPRGVSTAFGVALVLSGALVLVLATIRYRRGAPGIFHNPVRWEPRPGILFEGPPVLPGPVRAGVALPPHL